jgi:hypothetical protein
MMKRLSHAVDLGKKKLEKSGLTLDDAKILGIECLDVIEVSKLHRIYKPACALKINYLDFAGKPLPDWPKAKGFYRLRYLEQPRSFMEEKKELRYIQEPDTAPVAYYPANANWKAIAMDPSARIIITEGELKSAKACKEGFAAIGLGGVSNWKAIKRGITWLPSLDLIKWPRRPVYICFDSDFRTNPQVCLALRDLAEAVEQHGAYVFMASLPDIPEIEGKVGVDDFFVYYKGQPGRDNFNNIMHMAEPIGLSRVLWKFNDDYAYIANPGLIINQQTHAKIDPGAFVNHLEATEVYQERQPDINNNPSYKPVSGASSWIKWPLRNEAARISYEPGAEKFTGEPQRFNVWPGWGLEAKSGDVELFTQLVDHLFTGSEPYAKKWFLRWCAYPLKYPGVKLFTSVVLHGIKHGTGKSLVGYTLGRIYGKNFTEISQVDLHNHFNEWAEAKQFVMGDDVTGSNKRTDADFLKKLITQKEMRVNTKYVPSYVIDDCINYFFTANHPDSFFLEDDDRRFFIHEVTIEPLDEEFYVQYDLWLDSGGAAAVFDYLLKIDLGDFNPAAPAYKTKARDRMITNMQSDLAGWVRQLQLTPDVVLRVGEIQIMKDLFTSKELLQLYDPTNHTGTTANGLGRELARAGIRQVLEGQPVKLADGSQSRYYVVRNIKKWVESSHKEICGHLNAWNLCQGVVKVKY